MLTPNALAYVYEMDMTIKNVMLGMIEAIILDYSALIKLVEKDTLENSLMFLVYLLVGPVNHKLLSTRLRITM
jgi:hypothetical protein